MAGASAAPPLVDTRLLGKVPPFSGVEDFGSWSFQVKAYLGLISTNMLTGLAAAEAADMEITGVTEAQEENNRVLYFFLAMTLRGGALTRMRSVPQGCGFEAWRVLNARYGRSTPTSALGMLQAILDYDMSGDVEEKLLSLRTLADEYERKAGEAVTDSTLRAVVSKNVPEPLKQHVNLHAGRFKTFHELQEFIVDFVRSQRPWRPAPMTSSGAASSGGPAAMEVDFISKGRGKNKGKHKGKKGDQYDNKDGYRGGKGKEQNTKGKEQTAKGKSKTKQDGRFNGYCGKCGKYGHKQSECWSKLVNAVAGETDEQPAELVVSYVGPEPADEDEPDPTSKGCGGWVLHLDVAGRA